MELSIILNYIMTKRKRRCDISEASKLCIDSGFKYVDYTPDFVSENWRELALKDREVLDKAGIIVEQTHAPFNRYCQYDQNMFFTYYRRLFEASSLLGAKYVVVHADEYRTKDRYNEDEIVNFTYDYLAPFVDFSVKNNMTVAIENLFEDNSYRWPQINGKSRFTSRVEELIGIIEKFSSPNVKCCWDFGHAKCAYGLSGMTEAMKKVGEYIVCTHVHDNYFDRDLHLLPFLGDTDWEENMKVLKQAGYKGKLSFEFAYGNIPDELIGTFLKAAYSTGVYLSELFEKS